MGTGPGAARLGQPRSLPAPGGAQPGSLRPPVMDGLARSGLGANPQSAACWAQLDQQQASWYFWINTNKSSFSSWQVVLPLPPPAPRLPSSGAGARGEGGEADSGCPELGGDGSQALGLAGENLWARGLQSLPPALPPPVLLSGDSGSPL